MAGVGSRHGKAKLDWGVLQCLKTAQRGDDFAKRSANAAYPVVHRADAVHRNRDADAEPLLLPDRGGSQDALRQEAVRGYHDAGARQAPAGGTG